MAGLPASGKSTVATATARLLGCAVVSVDPIEAAMWGAGIDHDQPTGIAAYGVAEAVAREQLRLGQDVIVDAVNDVEPARQQWRNLAKEMGTSLLFVEVTCADEDEHRRRLHTRRRGIAGFPEPSWDAVMARREGFDGWTDSRLRLDSTVDIDASARAVADEVSRMLS